MDLFTAINIGILVYLIPFKFKKIVTVILCILIIAPIATTAYKEQSKINHENEINYSELSAYIFLKGKNGTLFTDSNSAHASWAYALTKINTSTLAFSKNRDLAIRIYYGSEDNSSAFENPYYFVYKEGILSNSKKIFDNGAVEVSVQNYKNNG